MKKPLDIDLTRLDWGKLEKRAKFLCLKPEELVSKLVLDFLHVYIGEEDN